ncbi:MAG: putative zinc-binding protein [Desulfatitalea sp.]|nr:putative zinc-binding protein [Desulfatitalea sp.]
MADNCCQSENEIMILSCSGGSNVGQLSNQAAVELTQEGFGKMFCLAGIGGRISGFVQSAKDTPAMVAIDGCKVGCAKATLESAGVPLQHYLVITDTGVEKNKNYNLERSDIDHVKAAVRQVVGENMRPEVAPPASAGGCSCGGTC